MARLRDRFAALEVQIEPTSDGNLRVRGKLTDELRLAIRAAKQTLLKELEEHGSDYDAPHYRWVVTWPTGRSFEFCALPEQRKCEVESRYPTARVEPAYDHPEDQSWLTQPVQ